MLVRKSTKKKLLRDAQTEAAKLREANLLAAGADSETARETLRILAAAQSKASAGQLTLAAAHAPLSEIAKAGGTAGEIRQWSIREWVTEWLDARLPVTARTANLGLIRVVPAVLPHSGSRRQSEQAENPGGARLARWNPWPFVP